MKLVEVIAGKETAPATVTAARRLVTRWGKTAVLPRTRRALSSTGFLMSSSARPSICMKKELMSGMLIKPSGWD